MTDRALRLLGAVRSGAHVKKFFIVFIRERTCVRMEMERDDYRVRDGRADG